MRSLLQLSITQIFVHWQLWLPVKIQLLREHGLKRRCLLHVRWNALWTGRLKVVRHVVVYVGQQLCNLQLVSVLAENLSDSGDERRTFRWVAKCMKTWNKIPNDEMHPTALSIYLHSATIVLLSKLLLLFQWHRLSMLKDIIIIIILTFKLTLNSDRHWNMKFTNNFHIPT